MTVQEAREMFGLRDNDLISREGIQGLILMREKHLRTTISQHEKEVTQKEIEALKILLEEAS